MHFSSVFLLVNQEEPTITCPGCLHNVDIAAVLQCLKHGLIARYLLGVGPLATVCVCVRAHGTSNRGDRRKHGALPHPTVNHHLCTISQSVFIWMIMS